MLSLSLRTLRIHASLGVSLHQYREYASKTEMTLLPPFEFGAIPFPEVRARGICSCEKRREIVFR
jgi:hypothetical protein